MLPSPASNKKPMLSLNIPASGSPEMPLRKLENMMLNQLIPLESPVANGERTSPGELQNLPSPTQLFGLPMMWNFGEEKQLSPVNHWNKMALSASPNIQAARPLQSPEKDSVKSDDYTPPKSARAREGTIHENIGKKPKI
jgi:hypothetical protein